MASPTLLVGNQSRDDAAVMDLGDGTAIISTTDFFLPIVDDPFDFGRIAAVNAISDVYAMGGDPLMAIAIFGWPQAKLSAEVAARVIAGGRAACLDAGIPLAGGHSIDNPEPLFGLAVTGRVRIDRMKANSAAQAGDRLYLTKPLGVGILTTAEKHGIVAAEHAIAARDSMVSLNRIGRELAAIDGVNALTDVTGFGLLGHLREVANGSGLTATINYSGVPRLLAAAVDQYILQGCVPGGTHRNWASFGDHIRLDVADTEHAIAVLCDPQTSGGLLVTVAPTACAAVEALLLEAGMPHEPFGHMGRLTDHDVVVVD